MTTEELLDLEKVGLPDDLPELTQTEILIGRTQELEMELIAYHQLLYGELDAYGHVRYAPDKDKAEEVRVSALKLAKSIVKGLQSKKD